jgi:hypothetical protein
MIVPNLEYNAWIAHNEEKMASTKYRRQYDSFVTNSFIHDHCSSEQKSERDKKCCEFKIKATAFVERKFEIKRQRSDQEYKIVLGKDDLDYFKACFDDQASFQEVTRNNNEKLIKNIEFIGNLVFNSIENESNSPEDHAGLSELIKFSVYRQIFLIFFQSWRRLQKLELYKKGYENIGRLINLCFKHCYSSKELW